MEIVVIMKTKRNIYIANTCKEENENEIIYDFKMKEKEIIILNSDSIYTAQLDGIVFLDDDTQLPVDSSMPATKISAYRCHQDFCELINEEELDEN